MNQQAFDCRLRSDQGHGVDSVCGFEDGDSVILQLGYEVARCFTIVRLVAQFVVHNQGTHVDEALPGLIGRAGSCVGDRLGLVQFREPHDLRLYASCGRRAGLGHTRKGATVHRISHLIVHWSL